jgi:hypothetical protein
MSGSSHARKHSCSGKDNYKYEFESKYQWAYGGSWAANKRQELSREETGHDATKRQKRSREETTGHSSDTSEHSQSGNYKYKFESKYQWKYGGSWAAKRQQRSREKLADSRSCTPSVPTRPAPEAPRGRG